MVNGAGVTQIGGFVGVVFRGWIVSPAAHVRANVRRRLGEDQGAKTPPENGATSSAEHWDNTAFGCRDVKSHDPNGTSTGYFRPQCCRI
jgi:hypothetical protein